MLQWNSRGKKNWQGKKKLIHGEKNFGRTEKGKNLKPKEPQKNLTSWQAADLPFGGGGGGPKRENLTAVSPSTEQVPSPDFPLLVIRTVTAPSIFGVSSLFLLLKSAKAAAFHQIILLLPGRRSLRRRKNQSFPFSSALKQAKQPLPPSLGNKQREPKPPFSLSQPSLPLPSGELSLHLPTGWPPPKPRQP